MQMDLTNAARELARKVEEVRGPRSLVLPYFSDLHTDSADAACVGRLTEALTAIAEAVHPDAVINLGDNPDMLGRKYHISNGDLQKLFSSLFDQMAACVDCPLLLINGNHDAVGTDFFKADLWNEVVKGKYDGGLARYHTEGSYYYVDFDGAKTRLVFLSLPYDSDTEAEHPTPLWGFGEEQIAWLRDVALKTDYDVLLFSHVPFFYEYRGDTEAMLEVWNGSHTAMSYISALCGWIEDLDEAVAAIEKSGRVRVCLSGHIHAESLWAAKETKEDAEGRWNPLPCPQYVTVRPVMPPKEGKTGIGIDVTVWNPDEKKLHIFRFGDGEDKVLDLA